MRPSSDWQWTGRDDAAESGDTRRLHQIMRHAAPDDSALLTDQPVLLGFASDAGVRRNHGRPGAARGPDAIRGALANLAAHGLDRCIDAGNIVCEDDNLEQSQQDYANTVTALLDRQAWPVLLGGGHEIAWGSFLGLRQHLDQRQDAGKVLVLNLDAHLDLRTSRPPSSGTPFDQIAVHCNAHGHAWRYACLGVSRASNTAALFDRAHALQATVVTDAALQAHHREATLSLLAGLLDEAKHVYLTIDLDVLPAACAPGVSAPAALGVPLEVIEAILLAVAASGKLRLADIAELNPALDRDGQTARVAARLAWQLLQADWRAAAPDMRKSRQPCL